jgi:hypothetical protein
LELTQVLFLAVHGCPTEGAYVCPIYLHLPPPQTWLSW